MYKIICWGAGKQAEKALSYLSFGQYDILYFVDGDKERQGKSFDSFVIKEPGFIISNDDIYDFILVTSGYWQEIFENCIRLGVECSKIKYFDVEELKIKDIDEMYACQAFSQDGEEIYLKERFMGITNGVYVDVGAFHPFRFSNTYWAYKQGWRGINIEPNCDNFSLLCALRTKDINLNCGISDKEGHMEYYVFKESALNTFCPEQITNREEIENVRKVETRRLDSIFQEYEIREIEYLDIDVEGMELKVLQSIDWNNVSINCILLEQRKMTLLDVIRSEEYKFLKNKGYVPVSKYNRTVIYEKVI